MMRASSLWLLVLTALIAPTTAVAATTQTSFVAILNSSQENPPNASTAIGNGLVTLNAAETSITVSLKFAGLSSDQTDAHIHGPAGVGSNAAVLFPIGDFGTTSGTATNIVFAVTPQQVGYLRAGLLYFNIHSTSLPGGEIRGQIQAMRDGKIAFVESVDDNTADIYVMNPDGSGITPLTNDSAGREFAPAWSPDGSKIAYVRLDTLAGIYVMNADGSGKTRIRSGNIFTHLDWSPDGTKIVFSQSNDIFTITADGLTVVQLTSNPNELDFNPNWSPDGSKIVFESYRNGSSTSDLWAMDSDGTNQVRLTTDTANFEWEADWSPDGSKIVYRGGAQNDIFVMDANGANQTNLTNSARVERSPSWSPDGAKLLFIAYNGYPAPGEIYSMNPDGSGVTLVRTVLLGLVAQSPTPPRFRPLLRLRLNRVSDFDGDGGTDLAVWRPGNGAWSSQDSFDAQLRVRSWGAESLNDLPVPGDYDGDGRIDAAVFRRVEGNWYVLNSFDSTSSVRSWGQSHDIPVPGDYDGDGKTDIAVWRPLEGNWYILNSATNTVTLKGWGGSGDKPVPADYDGDNRTDIAVFRPAEGTWYVILSQTNTGIVVGWGAGTDKLVPADYDGDRKADVAVWRPSEGNWYILNSSDNSVTVRNWGAGSLGDVPVPGDYDRDGRADIAIWRPSDSNWYIIQSATNTMRVGFWGESGDIPIPSVYIP